MSQAPWVRPQSPSVPPSPRFAPPSVPASPRPSTPGYRPSTPGHRHSASISALPPPSPRTPGHKVSQSLSGLQSFIETPKKPDLPSNPAAWIPSQLAQHLRYSLRYGLDGPTLPLPVVEDVVTWILRHRIDGTGFLAGVEGIGGSRPPFLPVLSVVSRKLRRTSRAQRHAALPLPEDMPEPEQTRVRRLAHAFESASEAEDDLHALRQQLTGNSIEGYGRATPRTTEKLAWHPRARTDSIGSNVSDSRWELSPTKREHAPSIDALLPRLSLESGHADDELEVLSTGVRSPSPESPLISPKLLFGAPGEDVPPLSPSSPLGDVTHISNLSAVLSPSDLFSPVRGAGSPADSPLACSKQVPAALSRAPPSPTALRKAKRVSSTKRLPSSFNDDESRKVTVTPKRRVSRKRQPSLMLSPAVERASPVRGPGSPLDVPSPVRAAGSPLRAEAPAPLRAVDVPVSPHIDLAEVGAAAAAEPTPTPEPEVIEVSRAEMTEVTPEPELEPPVTLVLPDLAPGSPRRMAQEVTALQDRVRELEQRLASVTPSATPFDTPVKHAAVATAPEPATDDELSFEKQTFLSGPSPSAGERSAAVDTGVQADTSVADASVQAETAVALHASEEHEGGWEAEWARTELADVDVAERCIPARLGLEASVAVQTSPLARFATTLEDEPEGAPIPAAAASKDAAPGDEPRSRSSSTSSMASTRGISRPLPKGWWHAFLSPDEAIPPMRDVPILFFMAGMGVGVSFGAVVVRVMLSRKLLHG